MKRRIIPIIISGAVQRSQGLAFPKRLFVLSTTPPMMRSVIPSKTRSTSIMVAMAAAAIPAVSV